MLVERRYCSWDFLPRVIGDRTLSGGIARRGFGFVSFVNGRWEEFKVPAWTPTLARRSRVDPASNARFSQLAQYRLPLIRSPVQLGGSHEVPNRDPPTP